MNEELVSRITASMDTITQWMEQVGSFVAEQAPLVVQEILMWGIVTNSLSIAGTMLVILLFLSIYGTILWNADRWTASATYGHGNNRDWTVKYMVQFMPLIIVLPVMLVGCSKVLDHIQQILKIQHAPRLYVMDQLSKLF